MNQGQRDLTAFWTVFVLFLVILFFAITGCAATRPAGIRRMAESHLVWCRDNDRNFEHCYTETRAYCVDAGIEPGCGEGYQP